LLALAAIFVVLSFPVWFDLDRYIGRLRTLSKAPLAAARRGKILCREGTQT
jgi:hypothetical protein